VIPEPHDFKPLAFQPFIPPYILPAPAMLSAIDFNDQFFIEADKIDNVAANNRLSTKFHAPAFRSKQMPEMLFSFCRFASQCSGDRR